MPLVISIVMHLSQQLSGINAVRTLCLQMHSDTHFKPTQNNFLLGVASYLIEIPPPHPLLADTIKFISKTFLYGDFIIYSLLIFNKLYFNF